MLKTTAGEHPMEPEIHNQSQRAFIRTPDQRLRVFVSSTLQELAEERRAVQEAISRLRLAPVMFELGARPHPPRDLYRAYLEQSQIFIGIYWQRYGWVAPGMEISGLEDEYRLSGDRPKLIYVKMPAPEREAQLEALLQKIRDDDQVSYRPFSTAAELQELVENDLALLLTERFELSNLGTVVSSLPGPPRLRLPVPATPLVGREQELTLLTELLGREAVRLVTLLGPGGIGKSRLSLEVASRLSESFVDGVGFVPLSAVSDPALVVPAIASALGVLTDGGQPPFDAAVTHLRDKHMLLVLDNFEQVTDAAPQVADLLQSLPRLKLLVTSRALLRLSGEHGVPLPPLSLPGRADRSPFEMLAQSEAVCLFVERAKAVKGDFTLTVDNALTIAEICYRLDGLPLAIELAAARLKILSPPALLKRLDRQLGFLVSGPRDLPERQQTLRNTIDWSYKLLSEEEQTLFSRLSIFVGGCTLEAAEAVCGEGLPDVLEGLASLMDKSLLRLSDHEGESRFMMLTTLREYAREQLEARGELETLRERRAEFYLRLAQEAQQGLMGAQQELWVTRLEAEYGNVRAVMRGALLRREDEVATLLPYSLFAYWWASSRFLDVRGWMQELLAVPRPLEPLVRARALLLYYGLGVSFLGDYEGALTGLEESLDLFRQEGDRSDVALAAGCLGIALLAPPESRPEEARVRLEEALQLFEVVENSWGIAAALTMLARVALFQGDVPRAQAIYARGLAEAQRLGDSLAVSMALHNLGGSALLQGELSHAATLFRESLQHELRMGNQLGITYNLRGLAGVAAARGEAERAARLLGASEAIVERLGGRAQEANFPYHQEAMGEVRAQSDPAAFAAAQAAGRKMNLEEAVAYALELGPA